MRSGLRIDVDTFRGTRDGVPRLLDVLARAGVKASFFFSVGPDNMGRHLWRLLRPTFFVKMLRTRAASLYGWDILLKGTFWPGPRIGDKLADTIRAAADAGHEIGLHAWDHQQWQARIERMSADTIADSIEKGVDTLRRITGRPPTCSASPGWRCTDAALLAKARFPFEYNTDCKGECVFLPVVNGEALAQPQVPTDLPTYDEVIGRDGVSEANYNEHMLTLFRDDRLNILTIHAEVEGIACADLFADFVTGALERGVAFVPLGEYVRDAPARRAAVVAKRVPGREGWVACQTGVEG